jgi:hypothetical protein
MLVNLIGLQSFYGRVILAHILCGLELLTAELHLYSQLVHKLPLSLGLLIHEVLPLVLQKGGALISAFGNQKVAVFEFPAYL